MCQLLPMNALCCTRSAWELLNENQTSSQQCISVSIKSSNTRPVEMLNLTNHNKNQYVRIFFRQILQLDIEQKYLMRDADPDKVVCQCAEDYQQSSREADTIQRVLRLRQ